MTNKFQETTGKINGLITDYERMMQEVQNTLREQIKGVFTAFFDAHPEVKTIHWTQYAPYFNDGDECVFSVHEPHFTKTPYRKLDGRDHAWGEDDDGIVETRVWDSEQRKYVDVELDPELVKDMQTMARIIQADANEGVFRAMFGEHVWVRAHAEGFTVEDYDHD